MTARYASGILLVVIPVPSLPLPLSPMHLLHVAQGPLSIPQLVALEPVAFAENQMLSGVQVGEKMVAEGSFDSLLQMALEQEPVERGAN